MARRSSYPATLSAAIDSFLPALPSVGAWSPAAVAVVALLSAWSAESTLAVRFVDARAVCRKTWPRRRAPGKTYTGFAMAVVRLGMPLVALLQAHFRTLVSSFEDGLARIEGWLVFAADGSRVEAPRTAANERALGCAGKAKSGPQFQVTVLWQLGLRQLFAWRIGRGVSSERRHLDGLVALLPPDALLVADAGFAGWRLVERMQREGRAFLLRVGGNILLLRDLLGVDCERRGDVVHLWPNSRRKERPLRLRLVVAGEGRTAVHLVTNVDDNRLSTEQAAVIYRLRWGVETFFRAVKQTLARRKLRSDSPTRAAFELHWLLLGCSLLGLQTATALIARGHAPGDWSVAAARKAVRAALRTNSARRLKEGLRNARRESRERTSSKKARNWPHKKRDKPCGSPIIRAATNAERRAAQRLYAATP
jgi:hypothetical protein